MICKYCGSEIDDGSDFCYICGQKVEPVAPAFAPVNENAVYNPGVVEAPAAPAAPVAPATVEAPVAEAAQNAQPAYQTQVPPSFDPLQAAPVAPVEAEGGKKKKAKKKKEKTPSAAGKAARFFSFLFALIGLILYKKAKKAGNEEKAVAILNALMRGLCVKMAIVCVVLAKKYMFS